MASKKVWYRLMPSGQDVNAVLQGEGVSSVALNAGDTIDDLKHAVIKAINFSGKPQDPRSTPATAVARGSQSTQMKQSEPTQPCARTRRNTAS